MGIYLPNMEMPKEGTVIVIDAAGQVWSNEWPTRGYIRLDGVTAVPVPPHGDLTDRDAYRYEFLSGVYDLCDDDPDNCRANAIIDLFDSAPTIIPASEEGE